MLNNNIAIGSLVTLDLQTRVLARTDNEETITLPASACLCLAAMVEARGDVLSQEQLMDIGWRSAGVEVTDNSVRVMINKLRRALVDLNVQDAITLVAVTRSGYRLIVRETPPELSPSVTQAPLTQPKAGSVPPAPATLATPISPPTATATAPSRSRRKKGALFAAGGLLTGLAIALILRSLYDFTPQQIHFVRWNGPGIPPGTEVMVQDDKQGQVRLIEGTLNTYTRHVLNRRPGEKPASVLYVTTGSEKMSQFQGLIACHQAFKDSGNDCESFYFRLY